MVECAPDPSLLESMRSVGYSLNTAIADIVDNSIASRARHIWIYFFDHGEEPYIAIVDDGEGMDFPTATKAMKLAGNNVLAKRDSDDLGRFGLGLKTASLSQARSLTLYSAKNDQPTVLRWDLDHIARVRSWDLEVLNGQQLNYIFPLKVREKLSAEHGTCVLWRNLDRLQNVAGHSLKDIDKAMEDLSQYLGLVFHRFLNPYSNDPLTPISITINDSPVPRRDPFLVDNLATQELPRQRINGTNAVLKGFTLPYQSKLKKSDRQLLGLGEEKSHTLFDNQGFYIYRAYRLITWGTWFRLLPKKESTKLSRVLVDIPNTMDSEWTLDIKKSRATPPKTVRDAMKQYVSLLAAPSKRTQRFRGRKTSDDPAAHIWNVIDERDGKYRYEINPSNEYVQQFIKSLPTVEKPAFKKMARILAAAFPYQDLQSRFSADEVGADTTVPEDQIREQAIAAWNLAQHVLHESAQHFVSRLKNQEPYTLLHNPEQVLKEVTHE